MRKLAAPVMALAIIGSAGLSLLQASEGRRLNAYLDPVGIPTICDGHTGPEVRLGLRYTSAQCDALTRQDVAATSAGIARCVTTPLNQNQHDALVVFAYNVGVTSTCKSTLVRRLNAKDFVGAANEFPKWKYATMGTRRVVLQGLVKRRAAERDLFLTRPADVAPRGLLGNLGHILTRSE